MFSLFQLQCVHAVTITFFTADIPKCIGCRFQNCWYCLGLRFLHRTSRNPHLCYCTTIVECSFHMYQQLLAGYIYHLKVTEHPSRQQVLLHTMKQQNCDASGSQDVLILKKSPFRKTHGFWVHQCDIIHE